MSTPRITRRSRKSLPSANSEPTLILHKSNPNNEVPERLRSENSTASPDRPVTAQTQSAPSIVKTQAVKNSSLRFEVTTPEHYKRGDVRSAPSKLGQYPKPDMPNEPLSPLANRRKRGHKTACATAYTTATEKEEHERTCEECQNVIRENWNAARNSRAPQAGQTQKSRKGDETGEHEFLGTSPSRRVTTSGKIPVHSTTLPDDQGDLGGIPQNTRGERSTQATHLAELQSETEAAAADEDPGDTPGEPHSRRANEREDGTTTDNSKPGISPGESNQCTSPSLAQDRLLELVNNNINPEDQVGFVYIFLDKETDLYKIGATRNLVKTRMHQVQRDCGLKLQLIDHRRVDYHLRTEALIQAELPDILFRYSCDGCKKRHTDRFQHKDGEFLRTCLHKWADFMNKAPYDSKVLKPFWSHRLEKITQPSSSKGFSFEELRNRWTKALVPSWYDSLLYDLGNLWANLRLFSWQANGVFAWLWLLIMYCDLITFLGFGATSFFAVKSIWPVANLKAA